MRIKRWLSLMLVFSLLFTGTSVINANDEKHYDFSSYTEDDAIRYVEEQGIVMPEGLEDVEGYETIILGIIQEAYNREDYQPSYNYTEMYRFALEITESVRAKTDYGNNKAKINTKASTYVLQHSTQYGEWKESYVNYNCYAYAIGKNIWIDPGYYSGNCTLVNTPIEQIASYVKQDLVKMGYVVNVSTTRPSSLSLGQNLICVRKAANDYHFMKYSGAAWYHKPGGTSLLRFNYSSAAQVNWSNECLIPNADRTYMVAHEPDIWYNSTIYYITYWTSTGSGVGTASAMP